MIQVLNNQDGTWTVINSENLKIAKIVRIYDKDAKRGYYYRVDDHEGITKKDRIDYFQSARGFCYDLIKS
ncbi:hypothetical protein J26TS2_44760 [Shouchella clausii]|nr:hypothetical protein J26TS2_44760 [Shouchella clausii]